MKILLFNDNPVVRKLVALSAQKTKDDLSVVWSTDEIEGNEYDLLIVDDALYSDEILDSINEKIVAKNTLFMATRGKAVPPGFDNVINKPFLPTDLVDMFVQIEKKVSVGRDQSDNEFEEHASSTSTYAINLEDSLSELEGDETEALVGAEDDLDFGDLDDYEDKFPETAILDQEEVQEVQELLEDTEEDDLTMDDDFSVEGSAPISLPDEEIGVPIELEDDFSLDDANILDEEKEEEELLGFDDIEENEIPSDEEVPKNDLSEDDEFGDLELPEPLEESSGLSDEDELLSMGEDDALGELELPEDDELSDMNDATSFDLSGLEEMDESMLMDDDELGDLESKIEDAVGGLESEELERELETDDFDLSLNDEMMEELMSTEEESLMDTGSFDELDMLDERELKIAVGEEVEEEDEPVLVAKGGSSLAAEALDEVLNESSPYAEFTDEIEEAEPVASHAEGVEALQALLKALSNENVSKSLKGMNISININFGNGA